MARRKGSVEFNADLEIGLALPLDARYLVKSKSDLTDASSWVADGSAYIYQGMQVYVSDEKEVYILIEKDYTKIASWKKLGGSAGGNAEFSSDLTVTNDIGKYTQGDFIKSGTQLEDVLKNILTKTYYPIITPPSLNLAYQVDAIMKVGNSVSAKNAILNYDRGLINPQYTADNMYCAGEANSYTLSLSGANIEYNETKTDDYNFSIPTFTKLSKGIVTITGSVDYQQGCQPKDSDGNNYLEPYEAGNMSTSKIIEFILPFYYGAVDSTDINSLTGLSEDLTEKANKTYKITTSNQYLCIVYDSSYGDLTSILDNNNFELIDGWTKQIKTIEGQTYNIWVSNGKTTDTDAQFTFKF